MRHGGSGCLLALFGFAPNGVPPRARAARAFGCSQTGGGGGDGARVAPTAPRGGSARAREVWLLPGGAPTPTPAIGATTGAPAAPWGSHRLSWPLTALPANGGVSRTTR